MSYPPEDDRGQRGLVRLPDGTYGFRYDEGADPIPLVTPRPAKAARPADGND
ncbi:hypothetical protein [Hoyosella subflava]|uniref:Uncharacterized protein n=1 Tax=Hoyosella subflava (strain DSM 45089 / JCM 17490 / NBRC 109087 / DQS3-9A1) TaxID=443218 RepID=F6ESL0_HOYSD|nr:hypothetical protein [Hoyosella subflava]AEF43131.1 hypothetical protein AS9A_P20087 [Hoyosella subflava DQS3-9A1]